MNSAAIRHLIRRMEAVTIPLLTIKVSSSNPFRDRIDAFANSLFGMTTYILPPGAEIDFIRPRNAVSVVAGKGSRRRGVRA